MSSDELNELQEHAERTKHDPSLAPVSITMAILAVLVAIVSLLGHRAATEAVLNQSRASDQWAYYQAKNIRGHEDRLFANLTRSFQQRTLTRWPRSARTMCMRPSVTKTSRKKAKPRPVSSRTTSNLS